MHVRFPQLSILAALLATIGTAQADDNPALPEIVVSADRHGLIGVADTATEGTITARQLANRPLLRPAEVMETVPGMIVTQHSGDGKANQYFLRGFNLDHGSDFATHVMGMPVNVASHAHGQGYMDLNFLIPELVGTVKYRKGVYAAEDGDFTTTGAARIDYQRRLHKPLIDATVGNNGYRRVLGAGSVDLDGRQLLGALEVGSNDGPWDQPEDLRKINFVGRLSRGNAANGYAFTAMAYRARWNATEHVPERAIASGEIRRFGALSGSDGGVTHRHSLSAEWAASDSAGSTKVSAYGVDYGLNLFSAPSGFINGGQGDQHEQADERITWGGQASRSWAFEKTELALGLQLRQDRIDKLGLYTTEQRRRVETVREDQITETAGALYLEARSQWTPWMRSTLGLRHDRIAARSTPIGGQHNMDNGGKVNAGQTSPKLSLIFEPYGDKVNTAFFINAGTGFHSNDVRGALSATNPSNGEPADKLSLFSRAKSAEAGMRLEPLSGWTSTLSLWTMDLGSELVFVGDEGVTEARGASTRKGVEWSNHYSTKHGVIVDGDLAWSRARFKQPVDGGGTQIPNAIPLTASVGVTYDDGGAWSGGARVRYLGAYALEETGTEESSPFWTANLRLGYRVSSKLQLSMDVLNLFDRRANDIEYWGGACTRNEQASGACGGGIDGRLVHPLEQRTIRLSLKASF